MIADHPLHHLPHTPKNTPKPAHTLAWCVEVQRLCDGICHHSTYHVLGRSQGQAMEMLLTLLDDMPGHLLSVTTQRIYPKSKGAQ